MEDVDEIKMKLNYLALRIRRKFPLNYTNFLAAGLLNLTKNYIRFFIPRKPRSLFSIRICIWGRKQLQLHNAAEVL
jgi:hypothetical protein